MKVLRALGTGRTARRPGRAGAGPGPAAPGCVFCGRPIAAAERCPLLPSSHWGCCSCRAPAAPASPGAA
jgi:hypothetical protein